MSQCLDVIRCRRLHCSCSKQFRTFHPGRKQRENNALYGNWREKRNWIALFYFLEVCRPRRRVATVRYVCVCVWLIIARRQNVHSSSTTWMTLQRTLLQCFITTWRPSATMTSRWRQMTQWSRDDVQACALWRATATLYNWTTAAAAAAAAVQMMQMEHRA